MSFTIVLLEIRILLQQLSRSIIWGLDFTQCVITEGVAKTLQILDQLWGHKQ